MQLKNVIESPCGLRYMLDELELQSGYARRWLLETEMMTTAEEVEAAYAVLRKFAAFVQQVDKTYITTLQFKLQKLKDIRTTIKNLHGGAILDDIELFEVKHLAILSTDVAKLLLAHGMEGVVAIPDLSPVITILDPDGMKIATFYIYDSYCKELKDLRKAMRSNPDEQEALLAQASELEAQVRADLSRDLRPFTASIEQALTSLARIDVFLAKALQMQRWGLCFPTLSATDVTRYEGLFNPQVLDALARVRKTFQPVDIEFGSTPTLITGANMGGKTVVLKTLTLCQYLFQYGFGIPAAAASITLRDEVHFCIGDDQSVEKGLSSFAAEMKHIDAVIAASRRGGHLLALIDEPARTTNPTEGTALVEALLDVLGHGQLSLVMTTHYDVSAHGAHCLRVKGLENGQMNYQLVNAPAGEVPHEALNIAESLGIDQQWIGRARQLLERNRDKNPERHII